MFSYAILGVVAGFVNMRRPIELLKCSKGPRSPYLAGSDVLEDRSFGVQCAFRL